MSDLVGGDDSWVEIVGEQLRGGATVAGLTPGQAVQVLGDAAAASPAFAQYVQRRAAANRPALTRTPMNAARDWNISFGPVSGAANTTTTLNQTPQVHFRGEKIMAVDTGTTAGQGTMIGTIFVGQKLQSPAGNNFTLTSFYANNALGNGVKWDTCEKAITISIQVSFIQACTFFATIWGKAVL